MKVVKWLDQHFEEVLLAIGLVVIVVVLTLQIIFRKVMGSSLAWSEELCRYIFMWSGMLTLSYTLHNGSAVKTELVINMFPKKVQRFTNIIIQIFMLLLFLLMTKVSAEVVPTITQMGTAIPVSREWIFLSMPVGFLLAVIRTIQNIVKAVKPVKGEEGAIC